MLESSYNLSLVAWSLVVAMLAAYTALNMASRVVSNEGRTSRWWLVGGAFAMGIGIWSMHFIGMLAFSLPIPLGYDPLLTTLSLFLAIVSSGIALILVCNKQLPWLRLLTGGLLMSVGIAGMHYLGMAAMLMQPGIVYDPLWVALSLVIAFGASVAALWVCFQLSRSSAYGQLARVGASVVMGLAIAGMHYTGMAAASFPVGTICGAAKSGVNVHWLSLLTIGMTLAAIAGTLIVSVIDSRMQLRAGELTDSLDQVNQELRHMAMHDGLTQLPNRILFEDRLDQAIESVKRNSGRIVLMMLDIDGFKVVNDAYGRHVGDRLLLGVANRLRQNLRAQDTLARLAGDEFVLLAAINEPSDAVALADKLLFAMHEPFNIAGQVLRVSISIGITLCPEDGVLRHDLLANADAARRHAKASGRNTYRFFESSMDANMYEQMRLLQDFRVALETHQLSLEYQPVYSVHEGRIEGCEALLRWTHPEYGKVPPGRFIPLAERTGLIIPIGDWVIDQACRQVRVWRNAGWPDARVAINLSAMQFAHVGLVDTLSKALTQYDIPPAALTLEVTETTAMHDTETSIVILKRLRDLGVRIAIDDFGTGYSSLLYLKRLPVSELKIDRGFVMEMTQERQDMAIIQAVIGLARILGLKVVAEGVETQSQYDLLAELDCDYIQGYLMGHPLSAEGVLELVMPRRRAAL